MAIADAYATFAEFKAATGLPVDTLQTTYEALLLTVSRLIEKYTGRNFNTTAAGVVRYFDGSGEGAIEVDDFTALTLIEVDDGSGAWATSIAMPASWIVYTPYAAAEKGEPYTGLMMRPGYAAATLSEWPALVYAVRTTGTMGWAAVPGAINVATIAITRQLRDLVESGLTLTLESVEQAVKVNPGSFHLLTSLQTEYSRRTPGAVASF